MYPDMLSHSRRSGTQASLSRLKAFVKVSKAPITTNDRKEYATLAYVDTKHSNIDGEKLAREDRSKA